MQDILHSDELYDPIGPLGYRALVIASALFGPALVIFTTSFETLSVTPDSVEYLSAADSLRSYATIRSVDGSPFVLWPPLLPVAIAFLSLLHVSTLQAAVIINAVSWMLMSIISGFWATDATRSRGLGIVTGLTISFSPALFVASLAVWSEVLFSFLALLSLWSLYGYLTTFSTRWLLAAAIACAAATLTRYAGAMLLFFEVIILLLATAKTCRVRHFLFFAFVAATPLLFWMARNYLAVGSPAGPRYPSDQLFAEVASKVGREIGSWLGQSGPSYAIILAGIAATFQGIVGIAALTTTRVKCAPRLDISVVLLAGFFVLYTTAIVGLSLSLNICCAVRLEAPAYPFFVMGLSLSIYSVLYRVAGLHTWRYRCSVGGAVFVLLLGIGIAVPKLVDSSSTFMRNGPRGYTAPSLVHSETFAYLRLYLEDAVMFSNDPQAIYFHTGLRAAVTPAKGGYVSSIRRDNRSEFAQRVAGARKVAIVWFRPSPRPWLFDVADLQERVRLNMVAHFADADIYTVEPL